MQPSMVYTCVLKFWGVQSGLRTVTADDSLNKSSKDSCVWLVVRKQLQFSISLHCCILVEYGNFLGENTTTDIQN